MCVSSKAVSFSSKNDYVQKNEYVRKSFLAYLWTKQQLKTSEHLRKVSVMKKAFRSPSWWDIYQALMGGQEITSPRIYYFAKKIKDHDRWIMNVWHIFSSQPMNNLMYSYPVRFRVNTFLAKSFLTGSNKINQGLLSKHDIFFPFFLESL